jgi:hypothetical protein
VIFYTPVDAELNAESESAHSIGRQYFTTEINSKKDQKWIKQGWQLKKHLHHRPEGSIVGQFGELILNQLSILHRMAYKISPGNTSFGSMVEMFLQPAPLFDRFLIFFSGFLLL